MSCCNALPLGSIPSALRSWPQTMFPLLALDVRANDNTRRAPTFNPINQTQQDVMVGLVERVRKGAGQYALSDPPSTRSSQTVPHSGDREETVIIVRGIIQFCQIATSAGVQSGIFCVCGNMTVH